MNKKWNHYLFKVFFLALQMYVKYTISMYTSKSVFNFYVWKNVAHAQKTRAFYMTISHYEELFRHFSGRYTVSHTYNECFNISRTSGRAQQICTHCRSRSLRWRWDECTWGRVRNATDCIILGSRELFEYYGLMVHSACASSTKISCLRENGEVWRMRLRARACVALR